MRESNISIKTWSSDMKEEIVLGYIKLVNGTV